MSIEDRIKLFGMSHTLVESDLDKAEKSLSLDLQRHPIENKDDQYYPQFELSLRNDAHRMASYYELFYCLERTIRSLVAETLQAQYGDNWWALRVPENVRKNANENIQREIDSGVTIRSENEIDYTTFGELGEIVRANQTEFGALFSSLKAFNKIMNSLNMLRGPIAHCCPLAEDEVMRLTLTVKDWFRLME